MTAEYYKAIVDYVTANILDGNGKPVYKTIGYWNEQTIHEMEGENKEIAYPKPALFIEFSEINLNQQLQNNICEKDFNVVFHLVFETLKNPKDWKATNDVLFLQTKQATYAALSFFSYSTSDLSQTFTKMLWQSETPQYNNHALIEAEQCYKVMMKDYTANKPLESTLITTLNIATLIASTQYISTLTQIGTAAPIPMVATNTLSGAGVFAYVSPGVYTYTLAGAFNANTEVQSDPNMNCVVTDANTITITTANDGALFNSNFIIQNYN